MGIQARSLLQQQFDLSLERANPYRSQLVRALPYNCTGGLCFQYGRQTLDNACPVCQGTGYLGVSRDGSGNLIITATGKPYDDKYPPASNSYRIYADVQTGHGLYGSGGEFIRLLADLGKMATGDGTCYTKMTDYDRATGNVVYPIIDITLPRPDRIISRHGSIFNIVEELIAEIGSEAICRIFVLERGSFIAPRGAGGK